MTEPADITSLESESATSPGGDFAITIGQARASDLAERYLRSLIFSGRLVPGDKLPSERELAAQFGIARITLRAALRSLETVGYLVIKIGSKGGAWINDAATLRKRWEEWMIAHHHEVDEMLEFRRLTETRIAYLAAERRTEEELSFSNRLPCRPRRIKRSVSQWHVGFHDALAKAAHNRFLEQAMQSIRYEFFVPADWAMTHKRVAEVEGVHDAILDAVRDQDPERAAVEMGIHLDATEAPFREVEQRA